MVKGYTQIPGVDFTESHSPVANDTTIRTVLAHAALESWVAEQIDVETAFLYGELEEEIYLAKPEGYNELSGDTMAEDEVLLLNKTLYGLVQAARVWLRTLIRFLVTHCGFIQSRADPCLLVKLDENRKLVVVLIIYVDDCLIVGKLHDVAFAISQIKRRFNIKELGSLKEYVGASFRRTTNGFEIRQQQLVESAIYYCGTLIGWRSKAQQCTTLSSTEAEYVACSQAATELEFVRQILESMGVNVQLPMTVYVDNTGAIELARNWSTSGRTKHIDVRFHYLRELVEQGMMELKFVRSENNTADIFTKNLSTNLFRQHVSSLGVELDPQ